MPVNIGIPRESKEGELRVGLTPVEVAVLVADGQQVRVESGAGDGIGHSDADFASAGARIGPPAAAWGADLVVKVKELQEGDLTRLAGGPAVFGYHHLVGEPAMACRLAACGVTAIAYEMVRDAAGRFPLRAPMSIVAGRMAVPIATGILGHPPAKVLVLGAGNAGASAARAAREAGAEVVVLSRSGGDGAAAATPQVIERHALDADLVVGAVFIPGTPTPKLLPRTLVARMRRGAVIVDISIDAGGVAETSRPTTHARPTFIEEGVIHYCVTNMPAAEPAEAAAAISAAVLPHARELAPQSIRRAVAEQTALRSRGRIL